MNSIRNLLASVLIASALAGCGSDSTTGPQGALPAGTLSFNHEGAVSGSFSVTGALTGTMHQSLSSGGFAVGARDAAVPAMGIYAFRLTEAGRLDQVSIVMEGAEPGTYAITDGADCVSQCAGVIMSFGQDAEAGEQGRHFALTSGTVVVTRVSDGKLEGTFSGTGIEYFGTGDDTGITIANGTFSVPAMAITPGDGIF